MSNSEVSSAFDETTERLYQKERSELLQAPKKSWPWLWFVISLVTFVLLGILALDPIDLACVVGVLLLHESGHFFGMRYFGYRDVQMFFIPIFGAAVRGEKRGVPAWQEAVVLLLGPLPGLLLGCAIFFIDLMTPLTHLRSAASLLVTINFLNLLPVGPLDGGKLCYCLLFKRSRLLESFAVVLGAVGFVFICLDEGWICLLLTALFSSILLAPNRYKTAAAAFELQARYPNLPSELVDMSDEQLRVLFQLTRERFGDISLQFRMKEVMSRALHQSASGSVTFGFMGVYLAAILLTLVTASTTRLKEDTGSWTMLLKQKVSGTTAEEPVKD